MKHGKFGDLGALLCTKADGIVLPLVSSDKPKSLYISYEFFI
jgi:hypothetical protein